MSSEDSHPTQADITEDSDTVNMNSYTKGVKINSYSSDLETAALEHMAYDSNFTEDINVKMRIPEKLTVAQEPSDQHSLSNAYSNSRPQSMPSAYNMEVPERIVVSVGDERVNYGQSMNPLYPETYASSNPTHDQVTLATPPRKLTLAERNMDSLEIQETQLKDSKSQNKVHSRSDHKLSDSSISNFQADRRQGHTKVNSAASSPLVPTKLMHSIQNKSRTLFERIVHGFNSVNTNPSKSPKNPAQSTSLTASSTTRMTCHVQPQTSSVMTDTLVPAVHNESVEELDDITMLRRQVFKLHRRITKMEKQDTERSRREIYLYAVTVGLCILNGWFIYNNRRIY